MIQMGNLWNNGFMNVYDFKRTRKFATARAMYNTVLSSKVLSHPLNDEYKSVS